MKNIKLLCLALVAVTAGLFTACTEEWEPGAPDSNQGVYFPTVTDFTVAAEDTSVEVVVKRNSTTDAVNVSLRAADLSESGLFSFPSSVAFDAGSDTSSVKISFDGSKLVAGEMHKILLQLDQDEASLYGYSEITFQIGIPEPWKSLGEGIFIDDFLCDMLGYGAGYWFPAQFEQHEVDTNRIRVLDAWGKYFFASLGGGELPGFVGFLDGTFALEFDVTDPDNVILVENPAYLGFTINFSDIGPAPILLYVFKEEDGTQTPGLVTYKDGIIQFEKQAVAIAIDNAGKLSLFDYANKSGAMAFVLPGVEVGDYTLSVAYDGMRVDADNKTVKAVIEFVPGVDVASYKFTIVPGNVTDATEIINGIVDGSLEDVQEGDFENTVWEISELTTGYNTVVAVSFNAEGEAKESVVYGFYFPGLGDAEAVEVAAAFYIDSIANLTGNAALEETYPSNSFYGFAFVFEDYTQIIGMRIFWANPDALHPALEAGEFTIEEIAAEGDDYTEWVLAYNEGNVRIMQAKPGEKICAIVAIDTIFGGTQYYHLDYVMPGGESAETSNATRSSASVDTLKVDYFYAPFTATTTSLVASDLAIASRK